MKKLLVLCLCIFCLGWSYKSVPLVECAWCHKTGKLSGLNRHHIIPQSVNTNTINVPTNIVVLCRNCHFVLGHKCRWTTYNPDVMIIITTYTNCYECKKE